MLGSSTTATTTARTTTPCLLSFAAVSSFSASAFSTSSSVWCWTLLPHQGSSHDMKTYDSSWSCSCCPNICGSNGKADVHHLPPSERKSISATSLLNPTRLIDRARENIQHTSNLFLHRNPKNECYWFRLVPYQRRHASTSQPAKPPSPRGFPSLSESEQESASDTANCWAFLAFCYLCDSDPFKLFSTFQ